MSRTKYEPSNAEFSNLAHLAARTHIYPCLLGADQDALRFDDTLLGSSGLNDILDGELAIDRFVHISTEGLRHPLRITVQERFRRMKFQCQKFITITEWNNASDLPSELYKISAGLFVYGFYDPNADTFADAIVVNVAGLICALGVGGLQYWTRTNKKKQDYICIAFDELSRAGCTMWRLPRYHGECLVETAPIYHQTTSTRQEALF